VLLWQLLGLPHQRHLMHLQRHLTVMMFAQEEYFVDCDLLDRLHLDLVLLMKEQQRQP
jgi:hypothetical protein